MARIKNHIDFACIFAGLGFAGAWALAPDRLASDLSPGLQGAGIALAAVAAIRLAAFARRWLKRTPGRNVRRPTWRTRPRPRYVAPRAQFGLRGTRR